MKKSLILLLFTFILVACSPADNPTPVNTVPAEDNSQSAATVEVPDVAAATVEVPDVAAATVEVPDVAAATVEAPDVAAATVESVAYNGPDWTNIQLTNARTGETFTFASLAGKVISVEPMATWCTNCRAQQSRIRDGVIGNVDDNIVMMSVSVETGLDDADLADYAERNGFDWLFVVAPPDLLMAWTTQFGRAVASPPSVPHFTITPDGTVSALTTGSKSADELISLLNSLKDS